MSEFGRYCCFWHPTEDLSVKSIGDVCPECGKPYEFPLTTAPKTVGKFDILSALGRGFYGSTYRAVDNSGRFSSRYVIKVIPVDVYRHFKKDFNKEVAAHHDACEGADYITKIHDAFEATVSFDGEELECHVAVLDDLPGFLLSDYVSGKQPLSTATAAQISIDLLRIHHELSTRKINHNDFHNGNIIIQSLSDQMRRQGALAPGIKAVAIDLGSVSTDRRSGGDYKGDLHWIAQHMNDLSRRLLETSEGQSDIGQRVALGFGVHCAVSNS